MRAARPDGPMRRLERLVAATGKYLGLIGTALKLAQLAPATVALAVLFFSPSAWLSDTLRRWALAGVVAGSATGVVAFVALRARAAQRGRLGAGLLVLGLACIVALRLHLALVDPAFVARWPLLLPLHDAVLGTDLGERLYNVGAAVWFALALLLATVGLPLYLRGRDDRRHADVSMPGTPDARRLDAAIGTLSDGIAALVHANDLLREENRRLRQRLAAREAADGRPAGDGPPGASASVPSERGIPAAANSGSGANTPSEAITTPEPSTAPVAGRAAVASDAGPARRS